MTTSGLDTASYLLLKKLRLQTTLSAIYVKDSRLDLANWELI